MRSFFINTFTGVIKEACLLFGEMAPYLLFGFLFAGILHIFIDTKSISRHLGQNNFLAVIKASLFGIPLPLCSCSVIPAAMSLRREGASKGAVLSFLISTPTTGIDSIFATYSLLGGFFAIYRVVASFVTGVLSGAAANFVLKNTKDKPVTEDSSGCKLCLRSGCSHSIRQKIKGVFSYAFGDLIKDTGPAFIVGVSIGGAIAYFVPNEFISMYLGSGWPAMFVMLLVGIPMYVCATASIPIAAALMMKGLDPGAAFVFLVAGPATNIVTMTVVARNMGRKALFVYLGAIAISSLSLGYVLNKVYFHFYDTSEVFNFILHKRILIPPSIQIFAGVILFLLILYRFTRDHNKEKPI
ncbi:MAG: SO_0444 family Cu/Zn efflux transporter [Candidatus Omnitrophica bacterium]|nr:SO_0444 family Cu/Zn efflux transporter [Candidatus Omnitrophota bacterium]